jgi:hypothetical protein
MSAAIAMEFAGIACFAGSPAGKASAFMRIPVHVVRCLETSAALPAGVVFS